MFGGAFGGGGGAQKGSPTYITIRPTLEDLYNGGELQYNFVKQVLCDHCSGTGAEDPDDVHTCNTCNGQGMVVQLIQIGLGGYMQSQSP